MSGEDTPPTLQFIGVAESNSTNIRTIAKRVERRHPEYSFAPVRDLVSGGDQSPKRSANLTNTVQRYFLCPVTIFHSNWMVVMYSHLLELSRNARKIK